MQLILRASDYDGADLKLFILDRWDRSSFLSVASSFGAQLMIFFCLRFSVMLFGRPGCNTLYLLSPRLCFFIV